MKKVIAFLFCITILSRSFSQVAPQSGSATFSLPMFSWQDHKSRLNLAIGINYNSGSGLKVSDVASNIGQGWSLLAGGVVTRVQAGEPDDQKPREGNGTVEDVTKYPAGYLYNNTELGCPDALTKYPVFGNKNHVYKQHNLVTADKEIDQFAFQFNGRTGIFILNKDTANTCISLNDNKMKIWFEKNEGMVSQGIRTTISAFYIQDENGLIYKFAQLELAKVLKIKYCNSQLTTAYTQPNFKGGNVYHEGSFDDNNYSDPANVPLVNPWIVNSWHLTEIRDPLTQRTIAFDYVVRNINAPAGTGISYYKEKNYSIISHIASITKSPVISSINFPDGHQATFNYGDARIDLSGDYALASVDINYSGRYLSRYQLTTSYVILNRYGTPTTRYQKSVARLYLLSLKRIGVDLAADEEPYLFDYYLGSSGNADDIVPPPFYHFKDVWGYYNGNNSLDYNNQPISLTTAISDLNNTQLKGLCFLRNGSATITLNPKTGYAKNGLLKQIIYPAGGALNYEYEQNTGILNGQTTNVGGVHVSKTKLVDGGYSNDCNNPIVTNYDYVNSGSTASSLWGLETPQNSTVIYSHYSPERRYFYYKPLFSFGCDYTYKYPGILSRDQSISLTSQQQFMLVLSQVLNMISGVMTIIDIVNIAVAATPAAIVAVVLDFIGSIINIVISCFSDQSRDNTSTVYYSSDLNGSNPLPCQFKRVEITESSGGNGKTVMEFTSSDDYPLWEPTNPSYSKKQRFAFWAYGLPKKTTIYNASGEKVKETENKYDLTFASHIPGDNGYSHFPPAEIQSCKCVVNKTSSQRNTDWENLSSLSYLTATTSDLTVDIYDIHSGRTQLDRTYERVYKPGNSSQYQSTITKYSYNSLYLPYIITTDKSDGSKTERVIKYSGEYQDYEIFNGEDVPPTQYSAGVLNKLNQNNIINLPVESTSAIIKANGEYLYLNENVAEFTETNTGDVKPYRNLEQRFNSPQPILRETPNGWVQNFNTYILPNHPDNPGYKEAQTFSYDASGNLIGVKDEGGHSITNIYDYNDKYIVASVINADPITDKAAYTSFETTGLGGWSLNGSTSYSSANSITGSRSLNLSGSNGITAPLNTAKAYKLSFWASSSISVSGGATLVKSAPVINGFTYYEYDIAQGTSGITITGTALMDELRLAPQTARMRSVSYDPLIGKTSECDENNRITYYEYDAHGRLQFIKDDQKNIVKMYEYNTAKNLQTCPITYYNNAISEIFTKDDCAAGYIGGDVTYIVPAGKYSSTISQADADQQAETELLATGQNYANAHGSCIQVFYNVAKSVSFTKDGCDVGYIGTSVSYNVPAGKYSSIISQADADQQAQDEIDANGQAYTNIPGVASCIVDTTPVWQGEGDPQLRCQVDGGGYYTGHQEILVTNINPNSTTYNQTKWQDIGPNSDACPHTCGFTYAAQWVGINTNITPVGNTLYFLWEFHATTTQSGSYYATPRLLGVISAGCAPPVVKTYTVIDAGKIWNLEVNPTGEVKISYGGGGTLSSGTYVQLNCSFDL